MSKLLRIVKMFNNDIKNCIEEDYIKSKLTMEVIANKYSCSIETIWQILKEKGVQSRKRNEFKKLTKELEQIEVVRYYISNQLTTIQIAEKYGVCSNVIRRVLIERGIQRRTLADKNRKYRKYALDVDILMKESHEKYYWLGFIMADGYVNESKGLMRINLALKDAQHLQHLCDFLGYAGSVKIQEQYNMAYLNISSEDLVYMLSFYGIVQKKSLIATPRNIPLRYQQSYIMGLFDGDGYLSYHAKRKAWWMGFCGSENIVKFIKKHIDKVLHKNIRIFPMGGIYYYQIGGSQQTYRLLQYFYQNHKSFYLTRKYERFKTLENYILDRKAA